MKLDEEQWKRINHMVCVYNEQKAFFDSYHCDWPGCKRKPYMEIFPLKDKPKNERECPCDEWEFSGWYYLCLRHFWYEHVRYFIKRHIQRKKVALGYGDVETMEEAFKRIEEELKDV